MSSFWNSPAWTMGKRVKKTTKKAGQPIPGPGNYNSSVNIGRHNPSWKIGEAVRDALKCQEVPGPGDYNIAASKSGPKITISSKIKASSLGDTLQPGPGNYNVTTDGVYKNTSAFTMGAKYGSSKIEDPEPGPATYNAALELKNNGPKMGTSKRGGLDGNNRNPGPGVYSQNRPFSAGPKYGFGNQAKSYSNLDKQPGPGQYQITLQIPSHIKGCIIGEKLSNKLYKNSAPGPGSYQMSSKRPQSGTKIGKASRITYNADIGPGPGAYNSGLKIKTGEIKIGTSLRREIFKTNTPGPGAYEFNIDGMKGITISGFKGKNQIEITPGPGAYELASQDIKRPCSAKYPFSQQRIGKGQRSNLGLNDTPGPGQYYPHDAVNYKFAYTKQARSKDLKVGEPGPGQYQIHPTVPSAPPYLIDHAVYKSYG